MVIASNIDAFVCIIHFSFCAYPHMFNKLCAYEHLVAIYVMYVMFGEHNRHRRNIPKILYWNSNGIAYLKKLVLIMRN